MFVCVCISVWSVNQSLASKDCKEGSVVAVDTETQHKMEGDVDTIYFVSIL